MMGHDHPMEAGRWITQDEWNVAQERIRELETEIGRHNMCLDVDSAEKLMAACGKMRWALEFITNLPDSACLQPPFMKIVRTALSTDVGENWISPEQAERLRKALEHIRREVADDSRWAIEIDKALEEA